MAASQIRLVAFDLAGTTIDFGSRAPAGVFVELFARHGVTVSEAEVRGPMGTATVSYTHLTLPTICSV